MPYLHLGGSRGAAPAFTRKSRWDGSRAAFAVAEGSKFQSRNQRVSRPDNSPSPSNWLRAGSSWVGVPFSPGRIEGYLSKVASIIRAPRVEMA